MEFVTSYLDCVLPDPLSLCHEYGLDPTKTQQGHLYARSESS